MCITYSSAKLWTVLGFFLCFWDLSRIMMVFETLDAVRRTFMDADGLRWVLTLYSFWLISLFCSCLSVFSCIVSLGSMICLVLLPCRAVNLYITLFFSMKIYWFIKNQSPVLLFILILEDAVICALTLDLWINYCFIYNMEYIKWWEHIRLVN